MNLNNVVVAANTARNYKLVSSILEFINAYSSEEGKKAKKR